MKRVLVTGSCGFAGTHFVEHVLKNTDWQIIGLDSFKHRGDSCRAIKNPRYTIFQCDLNAPISHRLAHKIGNIDYIVNYASDSHVDRSITDPVPFVQNNVNLILNILEYARTLPCLEKFIQISTDEVFGAALEGHNHQEWEHHLPSNPYAASKSAQEAIAISYWRTYGVPLIITNTMNLIGERQDPEKFLPMLIKKINSDEIVTIHGSENYIGKRKYLHCRNQSDAILFMLKNIDVIRYYDCIDYTIKPERFNVVGDIELNNLELAQKVAALLNKDLKYNLVDFHSARAGHDRRYSLDGSKLKQAGWIAPINFEQSLKRTIAWTLNNEEWLL